MMSFLVKLWGNDEDPDAFYHVDDDDSDSEGAVLPRVGSDPSLDGEDESEGATPSPNFRPLALFGVEGSTRRRLGFLDDERGGDAAPSAARGSQTEISDDWV